MSEGSEDSYDESEEEEEEVDESCLARFEVLEAPKGPRS